MKIDVLVAEIGSTTTVVNAFDRINEAEPVFLGQGQAPTSVLAGDVRVGLQGAVDDLCRHLGAEEVQYETMLATSSAAGGLRMTVHGLVYDMTVKAAKEAALGAGANLHLTTAGILEEDDLEDIRDIRPNLILLAGGTDYGERKTALENAKRLRELDLDVPVIYAGNVQNQNRVSRIFEGARAKLYITENVYPRLDELNIEPTRRIIHQVFEEHIIKAPGMEGIRDMVTGAILPTPGAVMECAQLLHDQLGDLLVLDVGGATTDIHSVTEGSEEIALIQITPEPVAKRTVEGDLGVYVNARSLAAPRTAGRPAGAGRAGPVRGLPAYPGHGGAVRPDGKADLVRRLHGPGAPLRKIPLYLRLQWPGHLCRRQGPDQGALSGGHRRRADPPAGPENDHGPAAGHQQLR